MGPNFECSLHLRTHPSYYIIANITSINLQGSNCSSGDSVQFRDSPSTKYAFDRLCAPYNNNTNNMISTLNSFQNELFVSFQRKNYRPNVTDDAAKKDVGITLSVDTKYRSKYKKCRLNYNISYFYQHIFFSRVRSNDSWFTHSHWQNSLSWVSGWTFSTSLLLFQVNW